MKGLGYLGMAFLIVVLAILAVRGIEHHQQVAQANTARASYCQRYYANEQERAAQVAAGQVSTVGDMLNLYDC